MVDHGRVDHLAVERDDAEALTFAVLGGGDDTGGVVDLLLRRRVGVVGATELTEENLATFPLDDINALTKEIMVFSGLMEKEGKLR